MNLFPQVKAEHYQFKHYADKARWCSFWHQIDELVSIPADSILEVGAGAGVLGAVLKKMGFPYESFDFDPALSPDHLGSVLDMPFKDNARDVIGCFEVLEHLPLEQFHIALSELFRVAKKAVVLSLPDAKPMWPFLFYIPKIGSRRLLFPKPVFAAAPHVFDGEHYWEINKKGCSIGKIRNLIKDNAQKAGFSLDREYRVWENPYHHFFVCVNKNVEAQMSAFSTPPPPVQ